MSIKTQNLRWGSTQRSSHPADKMVPMEMMKMLRNSSHGARKVIKRMHTKKSRSWSKEQCVPIEYPG